MPRCVTICLLLVSGLLAGCSSAGAPSTDGSRAPVSTGSVPKLHHVVLVILENTSYANAMADPNFAATSRQGALLRNYYGIAHHSLGNYLALASGATPTGAMNADCPQFNCALDTPSIASQLDDSKLAWKAYFGGTTNPCRTPVPGRADTFTRGYLTHHNPFAYYPAVGANSSGGTPGCRSHLRPLNELGDDAGKGQLPAFSLVIADSCEDGHDVPCEDSRPGGITTAGTWMRQTLATVTGSRDWGPDSLFVATFDESGSDDSSGCCGRQPGGGRVPTVLISPHIRPGTTSTHDYNHYSLLRTIEDGLGLSGHLGAAADATSIGDIWSAPATP